VLLVVGALVDGQLVAKGKAPAADVADERLAHVHPLYVLMQVAPSVEIQFTQRAAKPATLAHVMFSELMGLQGVIRAEGIIANFTFELLAECFGGHKTVASLNVTLLGQRKSHRLHVCESFNPSRIPLAHALNTVVHIVKGYQTHRKIRSQQVCDLHERRLAFT